MVGESLESTHHSDIESHHPPRICEASSGRRDHDGPGSSSSWKNLTQPWALWPPGEGSWAGEQHVPPASTQSDEAPVCLPVCPPTTSHSYWG